ncbi:hypothetical protein H2198_005904 [Neophaeococcomyces mojaviensis]|uniref:Uncharacterized protein n=1 Tax=Neophaeococcomyces mojaviensis TaxID=3383035 RepID=A0ACC3A4G5_9EURO|nr:hypothetical protein H2198_005904 [Knufia sp. JES_112]
MTSPEPSVIPSSPGDTVEERLDDSRLAPADVDDTASDILPRTGTPSSTKGAKRVRSGAKKPRPKKGVHVWVNEAAQDGTEDEATPVKVKNSGSVEPDIKTAGTAVGTRRQANGTVGSVYSGSKIRHIKKPDGVPLLRKEIQYAFLHEVVHDETLCFTRLGGSSPDASFADVYIGSMARSSKTSKVLKDRLQVDKAAARNMAMICLLVNVGRMNTTLNFFPEMRAQLRTYHPIPALQAYPTQKDYKSLQDAPRLKSILKGASEDTEEPRTLAQLRQARVPRTNPVNLIFVLSQAANEISQAHFLDKIDFFDLAIRSTISSHSRARAFLWLMWWYLESDFSKAAALQNPFGPGEYKDDQDPEDSDAIPLLVPKFEHLTEEEGDAENVDPEEEIVFGEKMTKERERLNAEFAQEEALMEAGGNGKAIEHKGVKRLKRTARDVGDDVDSSDVDSVRASPGASARSPAPMDTPAHPSTSGMQADSLEDDWEPMDNHPGRGRYKRVRGKNTPSRSRMRTSEVGASASVRGGARSRLGLNSDRGTPDTGRGTPQPFPPGVNHPVLTQFPTISQPQHTTIFGNSVGPSTAKSRARTGYQRELESHRQKRIDWLVNKKRRETLKAQHEKRVRTTPYSWLLCAAQRISTLDATYDSDEDDSGHTGLSLLGIPDHGSGLGGIIPRGKSTSATLRSEATVDGVKKEKDENTTAVADLTVHANNSEDDCGEEVEHWKRILLRTQRRLETWSGDKDYAAYLAYKNRYDERRAPPRHRPATGDLSSKLVRPRGLSGDESIPPSSVVGSTPRKHRHERRKSLDDEITQDLLAERSADEGDEEPEVEDDDGDVTMEPIAPVQTHNRSLSGAKRVPVKAGGGSDVEMD